MRFIIDMNLSQRWVDALAEQGFEATHWSRMGRADATDRAIMERAKASDSIVFTRDLDFSAILAANRLDKPSVVTIRDEDRFDPAVVRRVTMALNAFRAELKSGAILTIAGKRIRIRSLPIAQQDIP